jgi:hypothetical protein
MTLGEASGYVRLRVSPYVAQDPHAIQGSPLSPRHTGRADFPHPAFPGTFAAGRRKQWTGQLQRHQP